MYEICWWWTDVWKVHAPPKARPFMWLLLANRILIWNNLQRHGDQVGAHCEKHIRILSHIHFAAVILLGRFGVQSKVSGQWDTCWGSSFQEEIKVWLKDESIADKFLSLPFQVMWLNWIKSKWSYFSGLSQKGTNHLWRLGSICPA